MLVLLLFSMAARAQKAKKKISLRDSLDHGIDLSDYIIEANGFIPVPVIVTEPALGGFGGGMVPVFLKKKPPFRDSVNGKLKLTPVAPDITGGMAIYTANETWIAGLFRSGTLIKQRIKYVIGGAYANVNLSFYNTGSSGVEQEYKFNFRTVPIFLQAIKKISVSNWYIGMKYLFLRTELKYEGAVPSWVKPVEENSTVSQLGVVVEFDNRDNVFTPNKGLKLHLDGIRSDQALGSDYDFWHLDYYTYMYLKLIPKLIGGLRIDGQQMLGEPPFYLLPYISMRGIPAVRYQGKAVILTEGELRWDFYKRWSLMGFGGVGKAFNDWSKAGDATLAYSMGTGVRYLLARKFKLRVGVDVAKGPEEWAYYIVFGSNWLK